MQTRAVEKAAALSFSPDAKKTGCIMEEYTLFSKGEKLC
jgi:hypothetical protein